MEAQLFSFFNELGEIDVSGEVLLSGGWSGDFPRGNVGGEYGEYLQSVKGDKVHGRGVRNRG